MGRAISHQRREAQDLLKVWGPGSLALEALSGIESAMYQRGLKTIERAARGEVVRRGDFIRAKCLVSTQGGSDLNSLRAVLAWAAMLRLGYLSRIRYSIGIVIDALAALLKSATITDPREAITRPRPPSTQELAGRAIASLNLTPRILAQRPQPTRVPRG